MCACLTSSITSTNLTALSSHPSTNLSTQQKLKRRKYVPTKSQLVITVSNQYSFIHASCELYVNLLRIPYPWLCQLLDPLDFTVGDDVDVADNVRAVPLILLFDG